MQDEFISVVAALNSNPSYQDNELRGSRSAGFPLSKYVIIQRKSLIIVEVNQKF